MKSITLSVAAYERLKKAKQPGDSFSDVVLRAVPEKRRSFVGAAKDLVKGKAKPLGTEPLNDEFSET